MSNELSTDVIARSLMQNSEQTPMLISNESYLARFAKARLAGIILLNAEANGGNPDFSQIASIYKDKELPTLARYIATPGYAVPADKINEATLQVFSSACEAAKSCLEDPTSIENKAFRHEALRHASLAGYHAGNVGAENKSVRIG